MVMMAQTGSNLHQAASIPSENQLDAPGVRDQFAQAADCCHFPRRKMPNWRFALESGQQTEN
jgi:hypothetical protein